MSAEIINFIPRPRPTPQQEPLPPLAFRRLSLSDDLAMDHADTDTAPAEITSCADAGFTCDPE